MIRIEIETDNAAFQENGWDYELDRILKRVREHLTQGACVVDLRDSNGNTVGRVVVE
jgi:hypothetical protein